MFKHLMNGSSLLAIALRDANNDSGADAKTKLREKLAEGNTPKDQQEPPKKEEDSEGLEDDEEDEEDDENEEDEDELDENKEPEQKKEETEEEKAAREKQEKEARKIQRKQDRVQSRISELTAARKAAEDEVARLKAQLEANPDQKLTAEEIDSKAKALADQRKREEDLAKIQKDFDDDCEKLQKAAKKIDEKFDEKVSDMVDTFGPIPSFMIGVLSELENGAEVLAHIANDEDIAETIYDAKKAAKMTTLLVDISKKLIDAKKPPKRKISRVPDPVDRVTGSRSQSITLTEADTKNMPEYIRKRQAMIEERRKQGR